MNSLGIYISVPFCRSKCTYCNFASGVFPESYHRRYIERLTRDIRGIGMQARSLDAVLPHIVDSVYLGGGTPSILAPELLKNLFSTLRAEFWLDPVAEITMECAPGQIEADVLARAVESGVNRISFGVQSFVDREAAVTGRLHNRGSALEDIKRVQAAGIRSVNVDLIAGLPHQTAASWRESLDVLLDSGVDHASIYLLEVDEDSRLGREVTNHGSRYHAELVPSDDLVADFYTEAVERLNTAGILQYEISNFACDGAASIHNKKYWQRRPYVGFGLDAHSMLRGLDGNAIRFQQGDDLQDFMSGGSLAEIHPVPRSESLEEAWFLGLRMNQGVSLREIEAEFGPEVVSSRQPLLDELVCNGLLEETGVHVRLTDRGKLMSNEIFERFLDADRVEEQEFVVVD